MNTNALILFA